VVNVARIAWRAVVLLAALALVTSVAIDGARLVRALRYDAALDAAPAWSARAASAVDDGNTELPASTLFVRAHAAASAQRLQDALVLYQAAALDPAYALASHYNLGNLHLREALALAQRDELQRNPQPAELAKRHYRAALRIEPSHWPSKYNLERTLQLAPETPDDAAVAAGHAADRAVTSLRGFTLGLP
jgi:mxaK protein